MGQDEVNYSDAKIAEYNFLAQYECVLAKVHMRAITQYATLALRGAFLLNTMAGIAVFTQKDTGFWPLAFCAGGAVLRGAGSGNCVCCPNLFAECGAFGS